MAASHIVKVRTLFYNLKTRSISSYTFVLTNSQTDIIKHPIRNKWQYKIIVVIVFEDFLSDLMLLI